MLAATEFANVGLPEETKSISWNKLIQVMMILIESNNSVNNNNKEE